MDFRTSGQRDHRRRRMMSAGTEQSAVASGARRTLVGQRSGAGAEADEQPTTPAYTSSALPENRPRLVDYVPLRLWKASLLFVLLMSSIAALVTAHAWLPPHLAAKLVGTALDLAAPIGLATWLSSVMLLAGSVLAMAVYGVRSHKIDDYRGRYRVWRHAAIGWLVLSVCVGSNLAPTIATFMSSMTGGTLAGNVALWWAIPAATMVGYVTLVLLSDLNRCRMGSATLVLAVCSWSFATASILGWVPLEATERVLIESGAMLVGHSLLLAAMVVYARYVLRESQGLIVPHRAMAKAETAPEQDAATEPLPESESEPKRRFFSLRRGKKARIEPAHTGAQDERKPHVSARKIAQQKMDDDDAYENDDRAPRRSSAALATKAVRKKQPAATLKPKKAVADDDVDDEIAIEVARLEGLGGRLSKSQRKKLRKLRRQMGG